MKKVFAKDFSFYKLFWVFVIGCVVGSIYEEVLMFIRTYMRTGNLIWELRRGVIYGPFNIVYGVGALIMTVVLAKKNRPWKTTVIYGALLGGILEYTISFLQETFIKSISWDYSAYFLNINGRTTVPIMVFWGLLGLIFTKIVYPALSRLIESIPYKIGILWSRVLLVFLAINMIISWGAVIRQHYRRQDIPAFTPVGDFFDTYYPDDFLIKYFPNMIAK